MGLFSKNNKWGSSGRHGDHGKINPADGAKLNLYLYLSDTEWRAQFVSSDGTAASDPMGEAVLIAKDGGKSFADISEIIHRALKEIGNRQIRNIGTVSIVLNDPGITLLDNLDRHFSSANVAKIRQYGTETLHCEEVSYGFLRFGPAETAGTTTTRSDQGVFGFADVGVLRRYLGKLDRLAIKTVLIAPVAQNTIFDAQLNPGKATCGIYFGARSSVVVIGNAKHASVTTRKLPIGLFSLVDAVADANNVAVTDALTALDRRDCLSQVLLDPSRQTENHVPGQFERILGEPVRALGNEIDRTLQYFDVQRMGGRPDAIKLYGPVASIQGLANWLGNRLGVEVTDANATILDDLIHRPRTEGLNLLEGAKSPLISLGRVNYAWDKDRFLPEHELDSDEAAEEKAAAVIISGKAGAKREVPAARSRFTGLFGRAKVKEGPRRPKRTQRRPPQPPERQKGARAGFALLAIFAFVFLYGGYTTFIAPKISEFNGLTNAYVRTLHQNVALRTKKTQATAGNPVKHAVRSHNDKVLWTEKFLALGCYATKAIWLTDVFLTTASTTAAGKAEKIQKLTIKGAVLPSTDGHLLQISDYIRRLEEDRRGLFMGDFKRMTFEGATVDYEDVEEIIRFTIEGWYDKNKRKPVKKAVMSDDLSMAGCLAPDELENAARKEALLESSEPGNNAGMKR
jgi:hypothetical protein